MNLEAQNDAEIHSIRDQLQFLVNSAGSSRLHIGQVLDAIRNDRIRDNNFLHAFHNDHLPGFPTFDRRADSMELIEALPTDYVRISQLAVFFEQALHDTMPYRQHLHSTYTHLTNLLCWLEQSTLSLGQRVYYDVSRDTMLTKDRNPNNESDRDIRNFLMSRDADVLFEQMIRFYEHRLAAL
ncbi:uncharacterized protein [Littorina saxatilis]|uniref:uncharacterized protein n=1 Tax=Littorina saxatilis TaxID=31220 RepID=UPI0038B68BEE